MKEFPTQEKGRFPPTLLVTLPLLLLLDAYSIFKIKVGLEDGVMQSYVVLIGCDFCTID